ncbi:helix-turn-helix transcriptional regulator [Glaciibacter sp. 2TAF33]|uniref:helix-turn-helix transcriptional regulator n=1 Tax=Glaciibacter sp. 2TAF33 TaxID=3233015 RepID=UPI003F90FBC9
MEQRPPLPDRVSAVTALADPARLTLYELVTRSADPVSRDTAADATGLSRSTASFHLERLAALGLVDVEFRRLSGKTGPGAGRPAKLYRRATGEVSVSLPERHYDLAGDLLAAAIEESIQSGLPVREALRSVAGEAGRNRGAEAETLPRALEENGFEPCADGNDLVLGNCPFHRLAENHTDLVCELNFELVRGLAEGAGDAEHIVRSDPGAGRCCIRISRSAASAGEVETGGSDEA